MFPLRIAIFTASLVAMAAAALGQDQGARDWNDVLERARGQTVYWHAWAGDPRINAYIGWAGEQVERRYGVTLEHVKVEDTGAVVSRVLAEKSSGRTGDGSVDLVWINGENFKAMKDAGLLQAPGWVQQLPNWRFVDVAGKPTVLSDFTIPTDGQEAPWGMAQLVFMADPGRLGAVPRDLEALARWIDANPGRFTYPQPPDFTGTTFLKQALYALAPNADLLSQPATGSEAGKAVAALMDWLAERHPALWRQGRAFPRNYAALIGLLGDSEIDIAFAFNPAAASNAIANGDLPDSVRTFVFDGGTIGNTHFLAIPFNASAPEGARVVADFLMSPEAQARKQDPAVWGDPTILDIASLERADRDRFERLELGIATLSPAELGPVLPEPHPSWMVLVETAWKERFSNR